VIANVYRQYGGEVCGGVSIGFFFGGGGCAGGIGELPVELGCLELFEVGWCLAD